MQEFWRLAANHIIVANHVAALKNGAYGSFEDMLISLVVALAKAEEDYRQKTIAIHMKG